jgi:signal transduction histidine kinase/ActR/RegA family two-component response regulator
MRREDRILVLAPWGRDAQVIATLLERDGLLAEVAGSVDELCRMIGEDAAVVVLTEETIATAEARAMLLEAFAAQPPWSELPLVALTSGGIVTREGMALVSHLTPHVNVTLLERPLRTATLVAAVRAALRARRRQYDVRALLEQEQESRAEAEAASRRKDALLAMLAHELRNPLSAVRHAVMVARLDESRRGSALEIAQRQTTQLVHLVDDLVDVARITQGKIKLRREPVTLGMLLERTIEATRSVIEERGHALMLGPVPSLVLEGDPTRLEQVFVNLVTNAAKYTPPGGTIRITADVDGGELVLRVRDNGVGIAPDVLPHVFDLFAQADRTLDRAQGGLGIGLTVARQLVELHGGRIEASSEGPSRGAEFAVWLPAIPAVLRPADATAATPRAGKRVLVVEDNFDAAESLKMVLELSGHDVRVVHDGIAALAAVDDQMPEIMLVDIGLPGMDGYEVARRLRQLPAVRRFFLIALTGYGREEDRQRALEAGFDHHFTKPVNVDSLEGLIDRLGRGNAGDKEPTLH